MLTINVVTLFPEALAPFLATSIPGRAEQAGLVQYRLVQLRDFSHDRHQTVDDAPYGGGAGMVLKPEPFFEAVESLGRRQGPLLLLSARGARFTHQHAVRYSLLPELTLLCGHYKDVDQRVADGLGTEEISLGDFVLSGGEPAALVVVDAVTRLQPGALGDAAAPEHDSFSRGLLEHPQYTRPERFRDWAVPPVLLGGDHGKVARWRRVMSVWRTWQRRPDLLETADLSPEEQKWVDGFNQGRRPSDYI